jgi:UDP-N-acetylglucosamine diphosphorylase / glucose-1-phosphate thymidylyltransferase / UDP-N-acetylgalactosamine diphosphorylase / glucosamine-1-phosphate N-acetyltransferase / galactosamine-1-phosphate N-acetyltransferase
MIDLDLFIKQFPLPAELLMDLQPWQITAGLDEILLKYLPYLDKNYRISNSQAIHHSATIEPGVVLKGTVIIGEGCFIATGNYLRGGVFLDRKVSLGPGCEIKTSVISEGTTVAHFNFIGNSLIGSQVNFEAGSVIANHYNERENKRIFININNEILDTGLDKFGALVGDNSKIGANAVLSPGTLLRPGSIVKRLELIEQFKDRKKKKL